MGVGDMEKPNRRAASFMLENVTLIGLDTRDARSGTSKVQRSVRARVASKMHICLATIVFDQLKAARVHANKTLL